MKNGRKEGKTTETVETTNFHVVFAGNVSWNLTRKTPQTFLYFSGRVKYFPSKEIWEILFSFILHLSLNKQT